MLTGPGDKAVPQKRKKATKKSSSSTPAYKPPVTDVQSSGGDYGTKEANRYKKTKQYKSDAKAVYRDLPVEKRQQIIKHVDPQTPEGKAILSDHKARIERNEELARSAATKDIKSDADRRRTVKFTETDEFKHIVSDLHPEQRGILKRALGGALKKTIGQVIPGSQLPIIGSGGKQVIEEVVSNPSQYPRLAGDTAKSVIGIPAGVVAAVSDPTGTGKEIVKDYGRRYGPLLKGPAGEKEFRERIHKEGVAPEVFDLATVASAGGASSGRVTQTIAKAGKAGETAERIATERPRIRRTGGKSEEQAISENFIRNTARAATDGVRKKVTKRRAAKPNAPAHVREAASNGEVVPVLERTPIIGRQSKVRKDVAKTKSLRLAQQKAEQQREINSGAGKALRSLSQREQQAFKYALQLGAHDPKIAVQELKLRRDQIIAERAKDPELKIGKSDELPIINDLISHADEAFTPKLAQVVDVERKRGTRVAENDPGINDEQIAMRRALPQAEHLGVKRGGIDAAEALAVGNAELKAAKKARKKAGKKVTRLERTGGRSQGAAEVRVSQADRATAAQIAKAERAVKLHDKSAANHGSAGRELEAGQALARREAAKARLIELTKSIDRKPTGSLRVAERNEGKALEARQALARAEADVQAAKKNVKKAKKAKRSGELVDAEPSADFIARVMAEAQQRGLAEPGYFPSQKRPEGVFSAFAIGGKKRAATSKEYTGALFRTGRESTDPAVYETALAQNIKRKYNWNMVAEQFDKHSFTWSKAKTIGQLKDEIEARGIDPNSVAFWNPQLFRKTRDQLEKASDNNTEVDLLDEDLGHADVHQAVQNSAIDFRHLATAPEEFNKRGGWSLIPVEVFEEVMNDTKPSGRIARGYDIAKGKSSRLLLGNPAWLQFQTASNALLSGIAGTGPVDMVKAQAWWHKLSDDEREAIEPYIGVAKFHDEQTKLGGSANGRFVNAYRAFKSTSFYGKAHKLNPLDAIFRADNAQNNFFRRGVLYSQVKRDAYKRMGENATKIQNVQSRMSHLLDLGPDEMMKKVIDDPQVFERHAQYVNDFLGDYRTYTARERRIFGRSVMFYGFLRFSLRFMFYTMPATHPIMSSVMLQLGRLHVDELDEIFGTEPPPWELGNYYTKDGEKKFDVARLNPFFNASQYVDLESGHIKPQQLVGFVPPFVQAGLNQIAGKNLFFNQAWKVDGSTSEVRDANNTNRAEILLTDLLKGLGPAYTTGTKLDPEMRGKQGSDSSVLFPQPVKYKRADAIARNNAAKDLQDKTPEEVLREFLLPATGEDAKGPIKSARDYAASKTKKARKTGTKGLGVRVGGGLGSGQGVNVGGGSSGGLGVTP